MPTLVLHKIEIGREFDSIPSMTVWLNFKFPIYRQRENWERMRVTVTLSEIFRIFEDKVVI